MTTPGSNRSTLLELIDAAIRAPSSHNTQPWLFSVQDDEVGVFADRTRALPVNDPFDRELTISCGASLFNIRVAAASKGLRTTVILRPSSEDSDLLARVVLEPHQQNQFLARLRPSVDARRTTRDALQRAAVPEGLRRELSAAAACEGASLAFLEEDKREEVAKLIAEGDRLQFGNPSWRRELSSWIHPGQAEDGLVTSKIVAPISRLVVRHFDLGKRVASADQKLVKEAPLVAVMSTPGDDVKDWLRAGQALERVLLVATAHQMHAGYLNQPCQLAQLRGRLAALATPGEFPQVVLRLGPSEAPSRPSPRRPIEAVLKDGQRQRRRPADVFGQRPSPRQILASGIVRPLRS